MADWESNAFRSGARADARLMPGQRAARLVRIAGGLVSLVLVAGLAHWGYRLAMRQMHGIPVIAAPEGPARVAPATPGGELAEYQGLAVNAIAAIGEAAPTADQLMLARPPVGLSDQDVAFENLQASGGSSLSGPDPTAGPREVVPSPTLAALQPADGQLTEPLPDGPVDTVDDPMAVQGTATLPVPPQDLVAPGVPGVNRSPFPRAKGDGAPGDAIAGIAGPADLAAAWAGGEGQSAGGDDAAAAVAAAVAAAMSPPPDVDVDPATLEVGTLLVQIGAYGTEAEAKLEWDKTIARYGALMNGKRRVIQPAESGGRSFYRLRVEGFQDRDDATRFCAVLREGGQCVPAPVRG